MKRNICVVTGTRAEYGLLYTLMKKIADDDELQLQLVATGMHLSPEFGYTCQDIINDGFKIDREVEMLLSSDSDIGITKSIGLGVISFADVLNQLKPDLLILLGDRYEIFAAAQAALIAKIPIAHIAGGDITEGAFDEAIRHSITKMSHLHFVTNQNSLEIVRQLGENPKYIFNVGNLALDRIYTCEKINREEIQKLLNFTFQKKNLLITFHPITLDLINSSIQLSELLEALNSLGPDFGFIFTKPNADPGGRQIINQLENFVATNPNAALYTSLGQQLYYSLITHVDAVVGNSSSGIYEVPSLKKPTVNIGDRQKGRLMAASVISCEPQRHQIKNAILCAINMDCSDVINPYGMGDSSSRIINIIKSIEDYKILLKKQFYKVGEI